MARALLFVSISSTHLLLLTDATADRLRKEEVRPWNSWVPPASGDPPPPCGGQGVGCGWKKYVRITPKDDIYAMLPTERTKLLTKTENDVSDLKEQLEQDKKDHKDSIASLNQALATMQEKYEKEKDGLIAQETTGSEDRAAAADEVDGMLAETKSAGETLSDELSALKNLRSSTSGLMARMEVCGCKKPSLLTRSRRTRLSPPPTVADVTLARKINNLQDEKGDLDSDIYKEMTLSTEAQQVIEHRIEVLKINMQKEAAKASQADHAKAKDTKSVAKQKVAGTRYLEAEQSQLKRVQEDRKAVQSEHDELGAAMTRCGCVP